MLGQVTRDNLDALHERLAKVDDARQRDLIAEADQVRRDHSEFYQN